MIGTWHHICFKLLVWIAIDPLMPLLWLRELNRTSRTMQIFSQMAERLGASGEVSLDESNLIPQTEMDTLLRSPLS